MRLVDELGEIGAHQRQAEDDDVDGFVIQWRVGDVAHLHVLVQGHEIETVNVRMRGLERASEPSVATAHVDDDEIRGTLADVGDDLVQWLLGPTRHAGLAERRRMREVLPVGTLTA